MFDSRDDIDRLKNENEHLSAYYDMYFAMREQQDGCKENIQFSSFDGDEIKQQSLEGKPLIGNGEIDVSGLSKFFMDIFDIYKKFTTRKSDEVLATVEKLAPDLPAILEEFLFRKGDTQMQAHLSDSLPEEILVFLVII